MAVKISGLIKKEEEYDMNIKPGPTFLSLVPVKTPLKKRTAWFCTSITQVTFGPVRSYISVTWLTSDHTQKINKLADSGGPWVVSRARGDNHPEGWVFGSCTSPYFIFLASLPPPSTCPPFPPSYSPNGHFAGASSEGNMKGRRRESHLGVFRHTGPTTLRWHAIDSVWSWRS